MVQRRVAGWVCVTGLFFVRLASAQAPATSATAAFPAGSGSSPAPAEPPSTADPQQAQPPPPPVEAPPTESAVAPAAVPPANGGEVGPDFDAPPEEEPAAAKALVGLDMTFFTASPQGTKLTILAPMIRAVVPIGSFTLEGELPFVYYDTSVSFSVPGVTTIAVDDSGFLVANPTFATKYHYRKDDLDVYVGGGISLPLARLDRGDENAFAKTFGYGGALATRGAWNVWWYVPNALTLFVPAGVRYIQKQGVDVGFELGTGILLNTGSGDGTPLGALQVGGHVGYAAPFVETGLQVKGVRFPGDGDGDRFQISLEPYVRALFDRAYVGAGFLINPDEPYGPWLDTGSIWGLRVEGGARF